MNMNKNHDAYYVAPKEGYATFTKAGKPWPSFWAHLFEWTMMTVGFLFAALIVYMVIYALAFGEPKN